MSKGIDRMRRTAAAFALVGLVSLGAGCGTADDESGTTDDTAPTVAAATKAPATVKAKAKVAASNDGMTNGCDTVHQLFAALDAGDKTTAQSLKGKGKTTFDDIAATEATKNQQLATDAAAMASMLEFTLPEQPIYQSSLAETYAVDCVARYGAPALPS
jgi:hypothetical protein